MFAVGAVLSSSPSISPLADPISTAGNGQLILACLAGIAVIVVLISWLKMHPFLALILGSAALAAVAWIAPTAALTSFTNGFGSTAGAVGILIALGAMLGKILADSGGADNIVNRITDRLSGNMLPWGMALIAAIIGLPLFFEVGVVILVPVVILVARRASPASCSSTRPVAGSSSCSSTRAWPTSSPTGPPGRTSRCCCSAGW